MVPRASIRLDGGTQPRANINEEHVARLREALEGGATLPPLVVFYDGAEFWLADGFHRYHAQGDGPGLRCELRTGTRRDAVLFSLGANDAHGLPRSNEDKRRAVEALLGDAEWGARSDRWIAETAHVSPSFVGSLRPQLSTVDSSPAKRVGKDGKERALPAPKAKAAPRETSVADVIEELQAEPAAPAAPAPREEPNPRRVSADAPPDAGMLEDQARDALESAWAYVDDTMHPAAPFDALRAEWARLAAHIAKIEKARASKPPGVA